MHVIIEGPIGKKGTCAIWDQKIEESILDMWIGLLLSEQQKS